MKAKIRKIATFVEETLREMDCEISPPTRRAAAVAVIDNPYAGKYVDDLSELMAIGEELGELLAERAVAALGIAGPSARKLRQGRGCRGEWRTRTCGGDSASEAGNSGAARFGQRCSADSVVEKTRRPGRRARHSFGTQGCGVCAKPFRRHGSAAKRCSASE